MCVYLWAQIIKRGRIEIKRAICPESHTTNYSFPNSCLIFEKVIKSHGIKPKSSKRLWSEKSPPNHTVLLPVAWASFARIVTLMVGGSAAHFFVCEPCPHWDVTRPRSFLFLFFKRSTVSHSGHVPFERVFLCVHFQISFCIKQVFHLQSERNDAISLKDVHVLGLRVWEGRTPRRVGTSPPPPPEEIAWGDCEMLDAKAEGQQERVGCPPPSGRDTDRCWTWEGSPNSIY